jgi:hypothetical protein
MRMVWQVFRVAKVLDHDGLVIVTGTFRRTETCDCWFHNVACQEVGRHFGHLAKVLATASM